MGCCRPDPWWDVEGIGVLTGTGFLPQLPSHLSPDGAPRCRRRRGWRGFGREAAGGQGKMNKDTRRPDRCWETPFKIDS